MEIIEDEPLGRLYQCTRCMAIKSISFDKSGEQLDDLGEDGGIIGG